MNDLTRITVGILATWRLTSLIVNEDGPFKVFARLHNWANIYSPNFLAGLLDCVWCTSVWVGTGVAVIVLSPVWFVLWPFALSAGAILLDEVVNASDKGDE